MFLCLRTNMQFALFLVFAGTIHNLDTEVGDLFVDVKWLSRNALLLFEHISRVYGIQITNMAGLSPAV